MPLLMMLTLLMVSMAAVVVFMSPYKIVTLLMLFTELSSHTFVTIPIYSS